MRINVGDERLKLKENPGRPGRKVLAICTYDRPQIRSDASKVNLYCVVVRDLVRPDDRCDPPSDEGLVFRADLWLTERNLRRVARVLTACGATGEVDTDSDSALDALFGQAWLVGEVVESSRDKRWLEIDVDTLEAYRGDVDPAWGEVVNAAADRTRDRIEAQERSRAEARSRGGGRGGRGGGGHRDDDVPF